MNEFSICTVGICNAAKFRNLSGSNVILWIHSIAPVLQSQSPFHHPPPSTYHRAYWLDSRFTIVHHSCVLARMWHLERLYSAVAPWLKDDTIEISNDSTSHPRARSQLLCFPTSCPCLFHLIPKTRSSPGNPSIQDSFLPQTQCVLHLRCFGSLGMRRYLVDPRGLLDLTE